MIITKAKPFTADEIDKLKERFEIYIKTVIDVDKKICSAGMDVHFEGEKILLDQGSKQSNVWGGGIDLETKEIDYNSLINIRPNLKNPSNEILDPRLREIYHKLSVYFFKNIL